MSYPKLSTPPLIESIFLIRFRENLEKEQIESILHDEYISSIYNTESPKDRRHEGIYVLRSSEANKAIRINLDSVSLHCFKYQPFENIYKDFKAIVGVVTTIAKSLTIETINLRYLNSISVGDEEVVDLHDYLTFTVQTPFSISNFFLQLLVDNEDDEDMNGIIIGANREQSSADSESKPSIILDINVQKKTSIKSDDEEALRSLLFMMREFKNKLFFDSVQPTVLETYA